MFSGNDREANPVLLTDFGTPRFIVVPLTGLAAGLAAAGLLGSAVCFLPIPFVGIFHFFGSGPSSWPPPDMLPNLFGFMLSIMIAGGLLLLPVSMVLLSVASMLPASGPALMTIRLVLCGGAFASVEGVLLGGQWGPLLGVAGLLTGFLFARWTRRA